MGASNPTTVLALLALVGATLVAAELLSNRTLAQRLDDAATGSSSGGGLATWLLAPLQEGGGAFKLDVRNVIGLVITLLVASLAASAGVGGGAFFVPLFMVVVGLSLKDATVMSQAVIAAVSAASIAFNLPKRHPVHPTIKTLVSYDMCLTMTPALLLGVTTGVLLNAALPTWLITMLLLGLLAFMCSRTASKGLQQWRSESAARQRAAEAALLAASSQPAAAPAPGAVVVVSDADAGDAKPRVAPYPWLSLAGVVFLWFGFAGLALLRQQVPRCSPAFWAVFASQLAFGAVCSVLFAYYCVARPAQQAAAAAGGASEPLLPASGSVGSLLAAAHDARAAAAQASMAVLLVNALWVALAGSVAGIVGIGGGMLMAPMLLDSGVHPLAASATSNILVFMCSSSAALSFLLEGRVKVDYAAAYCLAGGAASLIGLTLVGRAVKASGRPSIVVLLLAGIMGVGGLVSGVFGYLDAWEQLAGGGGAGFKSIC